MELEGHPRARGSRTGCLKPIRQVKPNPGGVGRMATPASAEGEQVSRVRIPFQSLLHLQRQPLHAAAHVRVTGRYPDPNA